MSARIHIILSFFPVLFAASLHSQNIIFKTYTVNDGLVANSVRKVLQDSKGFLWIATWEGLSKYDGNKFTRYNTTNGLSFDLVNDLYEDAAGKIYLAENNGDLDIIEHDRIYRDTIHTNTIVNTFFKTPGNKVYVATDNKGFLEFGSYKWSRSVQQAFNAIIDFAVLNDSLNLIINTDLRPCVVDRRFTAYSTITKGPVGASVIRRDSKDRLWLCSNEGLKLFSAIQKKGKPVAFQPLPSAFDNPLLKNQAVIDFFEDKDGNYWISTLNGLVRIDKSGRFQLFTTKNGLPTNVLNNFYQDREKNIWMCSQSGLVKIVMKNNLGYFGKEEGLKTDQIVSIIPCKTCIYLNNSSDILKIDKQKNVVSSVLVAPDKNPLTAFLLDSTGSVSTLLTSKALYKKTQAAPLLVASESDGYFFCLAVDSAGNYFIGGFSGMIIRTTTKTIHLPSLPFRITALFFDQQGSLWAGTWSDGLFHLRLHYSNDDVYCEVADVSSFIPDKNIRSIFIDHQHNLWIGTRYKGVFRLTPKADGKYQVMNFDQQGGLNSNWIKAISEDKRGNIWIGTLQGLDKLIPVGNSFRVFDFSRINHSYGAVNCIYADYDGQMWYGGPSGLIRFNDDQLDTLKAPQVFLTAVQSQKPLAAEEEENESVLLPYNSNRINFEFSAPSFINENEILYSYRLRGAVDTAWSIPTNLHFVAYASLSPGDYSFDIRAIGWNGQPGKPTTFAFSIEKPFWQTWWFYLISFWLMALVVYILYRYRIRQVMKVQKVRNRIATDLHDDIGSSLTNIDILSTLSYRNINQPEQAKKFLKRITEEVSTTSQAMDDIIWNVNSENDSVQETVERMRRFAAELFDQSSVRCHLELDDTIHGKKMNMEQRRDVFLMYKEMLNNVYKHADAATTWIVVKLKKNILHLDVKDDGKGFDSTAVTHRNGLKNLYQRSARWNGTVRIASQPGKGTAIHISLPLSG
jgi:ligand-binding sensor domain-containing protein/two-component sensor histidine kinase